MDNLFNKETLVYRFFNSAGELLYVGITLDLFDRSKHHMKNKKWCKEITDIKVKWFPNRYMAKDAESVVLATENPKYNIETHEARYQTTLNRVI